MIKFVVTGPPRSGTQWMTTVLNEAGLECSHEALPWLRTTPWLEKADAVGECSWAAVPQEQMLRDSGTYLVDLMRHPIETADSITMQRILEHKSRRQFIEKYRPEVFRHKHAHDQALRFWLEWRVEGETWKLPPSASDLVNLGFQVGARVTHMSAARALDTPLVDKRPRARVARPKDYDPGLVREAMERWDRG